MSFDSEQYYKSKRWCSRYSSTNNSMIESSMHIEGRIRYLSIRIVRQYIYHTYHNLWDIIVNGDLEDEATPSGEQSSPPVPKTTKQLAARRNQERIKRCLDLDEFEENPKKIAKEDLNRKFLDRSSSFLESNIATDHGEISRIFDEFDIDDLLQHLSTNEVLVTASEILGFSNVVELNQVPFYSKSGWSQGRRPYGDNGRALHKHMTSSLGSGGSKMGLGGYDWSNDFDSSTCQNLCYLMAISSSMLISSSDSDGIECSNVLGILETVFKELMILKEEKHKKPN
ncbi:hypothetical protein Tco_0993966 [Tanacetum coccineum]